ncbi:MAG: type II and III secretion system protein [Candidatus Margulisiibacteriota bacterium]
MKQALGLLFLLLLTVSACSNDPGIEIVKSSEEESPPAEVLKIPTPEGVGQEKAPTEDGLVFKEPAASPEELIPVFEVMELKYLSGKKASEIVSRLIPEALAMEGEKGSSVILKGKPADMWKMKKILTSADRPVPQITIESRIMEISESGLRSIGFAWGSGVKVTIVPEEGKVRVGDIPAVLSALVSKGEAKLIASPRISTLDNLEASINIGDRIPYAVPVSGSAGVTQWAVQYIDAGVSLKILPRIGGDGMITAEIKPEVSSISEWRTTAAGDFPVISTRNASTSVRVESGQTIVVAGLINETDRENISKVPLAGDLPVIKELFLKRTKEKTKTDVVFLITPVVIAP